MVPPGYRGPLPEGVPTHAEWSQQKQLFKEEDDPHVN